MIEKFTFESGAALAAVEGEVVASVIVTDGLTGLGEIPMGLICAPVTFVHPKEAPKDVVHSMYFDGQVQSLGCHDLDGRRLTVGVIQPRPEPYDFGTAHEEECIRVRSGELTINGTQACAADDPVVVPRGQQIIIACPNGSATYICYYH
ncbi:MAG: DUF1255 family protein [Candidatus Kerfeldbacteria bacterium]|nr:DUF1255 family protein [Candidatus Kerfeldbacteria bacterium]